MGDGRFDLAKLANTFTPDDLKKITKDIASASASVTTLVTTGLGSTSYKTTHTGDLLKTYKDAQTNIENAPIDLSRAEKNYYVYKDGGGANYEKMIVDRFATTAGQFKQNSIDMQQEFMANLSQNINQYQSEVIFQEQSAKLLQVRKKEQEDLKKNINYYQKVVHTSERKVVYESKNMDSLYTYRRIMIFIYYAAIVCFIIFGNFIPDQLYFKYTVWIMIVIASIFPIILTMMIKWLFLFYDILAYWMSGPSPNAYMPRYKDVYMNMGNPGAEAAPEPPVEPAGMFGGTPPTPPM
jgi:hypothetical protein